jgi:protein-L-isoaspartate(D-aspartate) O-methyltransferase
MGLGTSFARWVFVALTGVGAACAAETSHGPGTGPAGAGQTDRASVHRKEMIDQQIRARGVRDPAVLEAMAKVPRERFVPNQFREAAYEDGPLPIGHNQTISQPYIVAYMTEALEVGAGDIVLEIGTGSAYQAAVLGEIVKDVYTIEIIPELAERAREILTDLGYTNVHVRAGDGYKGWPEHAPYNGIIVTAAPDHIPQPLIDQLAVGGRMVIPVGDANQEMVIVSKTERGIVEKRTIPVRFVPMTGEAIR